MKVAFVVATKDRPEELRQMLRSLAGQTRPPDQVVVVDGSAEPVRDAAEEFPSLSPKYVRHLPPSAAAQRNAGIQAADADADFIGFLDDDAVLHEDALERMLAFWESAPADVAGCAFNLADAGDLQRSLKRSLFAEKLGLYSATPGAVCPSGWQTLTGRVEETTFVEWLPTTAALWRRSVLASHRFDPFFDGYSYLEDAEFSYTVSRTNRLAVVADALFDHLPSPAGRMSSFGFGKVEVRNRLYFVRKHGLSIPKCLLGITIRLVMTVCSTLSARSLRPLGRAAGNFAGLFVSLGVRVPKAGAAHG